MKKLKKIIYLTFIFSLLSYFSVFPVDTLQNNDSYIKGEELLEKAKVEYDNGNYDLGIEYSIEAKKYFEIAKKEYYLLKLVEEIDKYGELAEQKIIQAEKLGVKNSEDEYIIELYEKAKNSFDEAAITYEQAEASEDLDEKINLYQTTEKSIKSAAKDATILVAELIPNPERDEADQLLETAFEKRENIINEGIMAQDDDDDQKIMDALNKSIDYYDTQKYKQSKEYSGAAILYIDRLVEDIQNKDKADMKLAQAFEKRDGMLEKTLIQENDSDDEKIMLVLNQSIENFDNKKYTKSIEKSDSAMVLMDMIANKDKFKADAEKMLNEAKAAVTETLEKDESNENADLIKKASEIYDDAVIAYENEAYTDSIDLSIKVIDMLSVLSTTLPKFYRVRLIPDNRDCLWKIAEYNFIYQDKYQWQIIYDKNKNVLSDPENPHLIHPGDLLEIPSLKGEKRAKDYDPNKVYPDFKEITK